MLYLTLTDETPGGAITDLGQVILSRECVDPTGKVAAYALESEGQRIGTVSGWLECYGPWRLAQTALNAIYGGTHVKRDTELKSDGICNAWTSRHHRCRLEARGGSYYCKIHDPIRSRR